jgi:hypothetical protein
MHGMFRTPRESRVRMRPIIRIRCDEDRSCDRAVSCVGALVEGRRTDRLAVRTKDVLRRMQNDNGSVERNSPANPPIYRSGVVARRCQSSDSPRDSDAPMNRTHPKRPHFAGPFLKRLMGFEPTTFCMASRRSSQLSYSRRGGQYSRGFRSGQASARPSTSSSNQARLPPARVCSRPHPSARRSTNSRP